VAGGVVAAGAGEAGANVGALVANAPRVWRVSLEPAVNAIWYAFPPAGSEKLVVTLMLRLATSGHDRVACGSSIMQALKKFAKPVLELRIASISPYSAALALSKSGLLNDEGTLGGSKPT
jgi:hypothetical protein